MKPTDKQYVGIPYAVRGKPPVCGDCWTVCRYFLARELRIQAPCYMYSAATLTEDSTGLISTLSALEQDWLKVTARPVDLALMKRGDLLIMTVAGHLQHCGMYLGDGEFIHSLIGRNSTLERVARWHTHIDAAMRWKG